MKRFKRYLLPIITVITIITSVICTIAYSLYEPNVGWSKTMLVPLANPPTFTEENVYSTYRGYATDITSASRLLYDATGLEFYVVELEVDVIEENINSTPDLVKYAHNFIEENFNISNAIVLYSATQKNRDLYDDYGNYVNYSVYEELYFGSEASNILKADLRSIFAESMEYNYYSDWDYRYTDSIKVFLNHSIYQDITKSKLAITYILIWLPSLILCVVIIVSSVKARKHRETLEILSTPISELADNSVDDLIDKYDGK